MQYVPLVYAHLDGFRLLGAQLCTPLRSSQLHLAARWAETYVRGASMTTFLVGRYAAAASLFSSPVASVPVAEQIVRDPATRRRLLRQGGAAFAWMTLAALAGTPVAEIAGRAVAACGVLRGAFPIRAGLTMFSQEG